MSTFTRARRAAIGVACAAAAPLAARAGQPLDLPGTVKFKLALAQVIAGTYGGICHKTVRGETILNAGSAVTFGSDATLSWAGHSADMIHKPVSSVVLTIGPSEKVVLYGVDMRIQNGSGSIYSINTLNDPPTTATVVNENDDLGNGCVQPGKPPAVKADLWLLASKFISVSSRNAKCVGSSALKLKSAPIEFSSTRLVVGDYMLNAAAPRLSESLLISDSPPEFTYQVHDAAGNMAMVTIKPDGSLRSMQVTESSAVFGCKP